MATVTIDADRWERVSAVVKVFTSADHEGVACDFHGKGAIRLGKAFEAAVDAVRLHPGDLDDLAPVAPVPAAVIAPPVDVDAVMSAVEQFGEAKAYWAGALVNNDIEILEEASVKRDSALAAIRALLGAGGAS